MTDLRIKVRDNLHLSGIRLTDKPALLEYLQSGDIYQTTLTIPYPYREADADWWLQKRIAHTQNIGKEVSFAIRNSDANLIGVIGADNFEGGTTHKAEIGYWLAKPFWGQGIMTDAVRAYVRYAFDELRLVRVTAHVFEHNAGSARVLEKNGFKLEGQLRKHYRKDGKLLDALFYGLLREEAF